MTGDKAYHERISRKLEVAEGELARARQYEDLIKSLYEEARTAKIRSCGGGLSIGIGIGVGGGHDHHGRDHHHDRDRWDPPREKPPGDRDVKHD